jgi:uncharacterized membrane protein
MLFQSIFKKVNMKRSVLFVVVFLSVGGLSAGAADFASVKPILTAKCAICHASEANRPFSSKIPVWNFTSGTNIKLARKKYDMDKLLAAGDAADVASLQLLEYVVRRQSMPPVQYKFLRPSKRLTDEERGSILNWIYTQYPEWEALT